MDLYSALDDKYLVDPQGAQTWITQFNLQTTPCLPLNLVRVHQMAPPRTVVTTTSRSLLLIYRPRMDERLSRPSWLTYSERFTHISGHPSAVGRAQDSESSPVKDQRSTAEPRNQPTDPHTVAIRRRASASSQLFTFWHQNASHVHIVRHRKRSQHSRRVQFISSYVEQ